MIRHVLGDACGLTLGRSASRCTGDVILYVENDVDEKARVDDSEIWTDGNCSIWRVRSRA